MTIDDSPTNEAALKLAARSVSPVTYKPDDRGHFCHHCGQAAWRHRHVRGVGRTCYKGTDNA